MNPEAQNVAIAKACGWHEPHSTGRDSPYWTDRNHTAYGSTRPPCYTLDLNAMREALLTLTGQQAMHYRCVLTQMAVDRGLDPMMASAAQVAEAFLKTLNLWQDES
jgi:hypothetical protein